MTFTAMTNHNDSFPKRKAVKETALICDGRISKL